MSPRFEIPGGFRIQPVGDALPLEKKLQRKRRRARAARRTRKGTLSTVARPAKRRGVLQTIARPERRASTFSGFGGARRAPAAPSEERRTLAAPRRQTLGAPRRDDDRLIKAKKKKVSHYKTD